MKTSQATLDPADWQAFRLQGHRMLDDIFDHLQHLRDTPVWHPAPDVARTAFQHALPHGESDLSLAHDIFMREVLPYAAGNSHPGFMGWVHGGGTPVGMLAEMLAAGLNANLGGRNQMPVEVERQMVAWVRELFGFPETASGLLVTGTSMANFMGLLVARFAALGESSRPEGLTDGHRLTAYTSAGAHLSIAQALDMAGLGTAALRKIAVDEQHRMDVAALERAIAADRAAGLMPFFIAATAGTVDVGAIDPLEAIADLAQREQIWFHVDGAYAALGKMAPDIAPLLLGMERADSIAFDFHKWGQVPYDAGFLLVRDGELHRRTFSSPAAYLHRETRGLAGGSPWPCDFGPDLSRSFRALKTWFTLQVYGADKLGQVISHTCELARYLRGRIADTARLELLAPVALNIVCFRYLGADASGRALDDFSSDRLNAEILIAVQESGIAAPSGTHVKGRFAIRAAIVNHRTVAADIDALVDAVLATGAALEQGIHSKAEHGN
ncbi:MAG: aspartate aminotransferase family protein [Gallionella sp.]|nr:aspartate aminotransferase family protein [Gallionella sp.]MDD4945746.1 aspartate aminotransferase family protein [Gallionella sp.]MDD5612041.1 aspartate aminotransferase family protein [Gallionella sp.]